VSTIRVTHGIPTPPGPLDPLDTTLFETYLLGGFGGTTQGPTWHGHFNEEILVRWPNYRDGITGFPGANATVDQYDMGRLALHAYHFFGQVRNTWDDRFIDAAEASARIFHKFYTEQGVLSYWQTQTSGLRMLYQLDPDSYGWCLDGLEVYYNIVKGAYGDDYWHRREAYCREWSYLLTSMFNRFFVKAPGFADPEHASGRNYHSLALDFLRYFPRQWMDEWSQPWAGGFADQIEYGCRVGNIQNWQYWTGSLSSPSTQINLASLNQFMFSIWFEAASLLYLHDPVYQNDAQLLSDMIALADYIQVEAWDTDSGFMWYQIGECLTQYFEVDGHYPAGGCASNTGWGDIRPYGNGSVVLTAFSLNMCGFLWHVTGDQKWITYGDRNWNAFWTSLGNGDPLDSDNLWSYGGKSFTESITHCFDYLKWRDYPDLFTEADADWSPTYGGSIQWPN